VFWHYNLNLNLNQNPNHQWALNHANSYPQTVHSLRALPRLRATRLYRKN